MSNFSHRILFLCSFHLLCNFGFISFHDDTGESAPSTDLRSQKKEHLKLLKNGVGSVLDMYSRRGLALTKGQWRQTRYWPMGYLVGCTFVAWRAGTTRPWCYLNIQRESVNLYRIELNSTHGPNFDQQGQKKRKVHNCEFQVSKDNVVPEVWLNTPIS